VYIFATSSRVRISRAAPRFGWFIRKGREGISGKFSGAQQVIEQQLHRAQVLVNGLVAHRPAILQTRLVFHSFAVSFKVCRRGRLDAPGAEPLGPVQEAPRRPVMARQAALGVAQCGHPRDEFVQVGFVRRSLDIQDSDS
jgi:hypothetical protein